MNSGLITAWHENGVEGYGIQGKINGSYIVHMRLYENGEQAVEPTFDLPVIFDAILHFSTNEISF